MANEEEVLGSRKTMFVLVIVVGCFAVLWPKILSPLVLGQGRDPLKPNQFDRDAALKQERPLMRGAGPHPALRERGRAIPANTPPARAPVVLPPHIRVRPSPLSVYYDVDVKPPPIPGMRPPLGSPGGPVQAPKSSMGFVMPIYTICIIVFFVYTLSKILFKRTGSVPYEQVSPDPQFRRRVFRDDSRASPETKLVVTAISGLVAEVRQQMEASYEQNQQRQDVQDNNARPYTNGTIRKDEPIRIIASEYREKEPSPILEETKEELTLTQKEEETKEQIEESDEIVKDSIRVPELKEIKKELSEEEEIEELLANAEDEDLVLENQFVKNEPDSANAKAFSEDFIREAIETRIEEDKKKTTPELLEEALEEKSEEEEEIEEEGDEVEPESTVKVLGMETSAHAADGGAVPPPRPPAQPHADRHEAEDVKSIYLETEIPQQSKVIVTDFAEDRTSTPEPAKASAKKNTPLVVSGKMTLSLIQDAPRDTPDRDLESTVDDYTTASAMTQPVDEEKKGEESSEEELEEEEVEIEEIEEIEEEKETN